MAEVMETTSLIRPVQAVLVSVIPPQRDNVHNLVSINSINPNVLLQLSWLTVVLSRGMSFSVHRSI